MGLGHLIRSTIVSHALASVGERPVIFSGGEYRPAGLDAVSSPVSALAVGRDGRGSQARILRTATRWPNISLPAVVVEDTHPAPIQLPPAIRRVLLVRPHFFRVSGPSERKLAASTRPSCCAIRRILLLGLTTKPRRRQLAGWQELARHRPLLPHRLPRTRSARCGTRYHLSGGEEVCVFSMGGGGVHVQRPEGPGLYSFPEARLASGGRRAEQPDHVHACFSCAAPTFRRASPSLRNSRSCPTKTRCRRC